jgi:SAM-dependent methyltransferase
MLTTILASLNRLFPGGEYAASRRWFEFISRRDSGRDMLFMNYGLALDEPLGLSTDDKPDRYSIQLYHRVANAVDLAGLEVLEVGSGRGGGASYVKRYLKPARVLGVDLAASAVAFCRAHYDVPGLSFERGDAEALDLPDASFDAVLNIESSVCYEHPERFFAEVVRVLRPGGHFLYADVRARSELPVWEQRLAATGLEKIEEEDLTARVVAALDQDSRRRNRLIAEHAPWGLRKVFAEFAGVRGSNFYYEAMKRREKVYRRYLFRKDSGLS